MKDGDTFLCKSRNHVWEVRLSSIDAPEKGQLGYMFSQLVLSSLIMSEFVHLKVLNVDAYKRKVCIVMCNNQDISLMMLKRGAAYHYKKYCNNAYFDKIEKEAIQNKIGIHALDGELKPWEFRLRN